MARKQNEERQIGLSKAFEKMDVEVAENVLRDNLRGHEEQAEKRDLDPAKSSATENAARAQTNFKKRSTKEKKQGGQNPDKPLDFYVTNLREEGRLRHFLHQLARLCHLRGDMIPRAQESLMQKFLLNRKDRHHLQQMSSAHALRSEEALGNGNARLALLERLEAWRKMPRDLSLLIDVAEAYIEPQNFVKTRRLKENTRAQEAQDQNVGIADSDTATLKKQKNRRWWGSGSSAPTARHKAAEQAQEMADRLKKKEKQKAHQLQEKTARQLFRLSAGKYRRQALNYLKKAVELFIALEQESDDGDQPAKEILAEDLHRLKKLQQNYPHIDWKHYTESIRALNGHPRKRWPWILLALLLLIVIVGATIYLPWRSWLHLWSAKEDIEVQQTIQPSEQTLLDSPVPTNWSVAPEQDQSFDKVIQVSQRLKLDQYYAYEVQGHIRVKPKAAPKDDQSSIATGPARWQRLRAVEPFELFLNYQHQGQNFEKRLAFSYDREDDPNEMERAPIMEGDTVLFREVFRLPNGPASDDRLLAKIVTVGKSPQPQLVDLTEGGFAQALNSIDLNGNPVPTVALGFRQKVIRSDGEKIRRVGYDIELQNNSNQPLDKLELQLNWREEDGILSKQNSPLLMQRDYTIISDSGTNLPGQARTTQRLWLDVPEDLNYPIENLVPQVRILENLLVSE